MAHREELPLAHRFLLAALVGVPLAILAAATIVPIAPRAAGALGFPCFPGLGRGALAILLAARWFSTLTVEALHSSA